jgi:hypothetical protein
MVHGKLSNKLKKFLKSNKLSEELQSTLLVQEKTIAKSIRKKMGLNCITNENVTELSRVVKQYL